MTTLGSLDLEMVIGGAAVSATREAGSFWSRPVQDKVSGDNTISQSDAMNSFGRTPRTREVDEDGRPYATGPSWRGR